MLNPTTLGVDEKDYTTTYVVADNSMRIVMTFADIVCGDKSPNSVARVNTVISVHKKHVPQKKQIARFTLAWWKLYLDNFATYVETTGLHGAVHAVEKMDAISQAPSLPMKIYLDEIDKLGNYEYILP